MRACVLTATGGIEHLKVSDVPDAPPPATGQVRVAIRAAALNHLDLFVVQGLPGSEHQLPHIVCADGAGVDRKSTRLNSSHGYISYAVFCLKKKKHNSNP